MTRKIVRLLTILCFCFLFIWGCEEFFRRVIGGFAGSYPFAETWDLYAKEKDVIQAIDELKKENLNIKPPNDSSYDYSYWHFIDFFYADTRQTVHTWIRPGSDSIGTTIAFVSLSGPDIKGADKLINKDFWYLSNKREISKFKQCILDKLEEKLYSH